MINKLSIEEKAAALIMLALAFVLWQPGYGSLDLFRNSLHAWPFAVIGACAAFIIKKSK